MDEEFKKDLIVSLVMGDPIKDSKSPLMHTAGYQALGIERDFIFLPSEVKPENLEKAMNSARNLQIRGISVTMPHKQEIIKYLDILDDDAEEIGAVNTIVNEDGEMVGYNTDWIGAVKALKKKTHLSGKKVAVIGTGGAARAVIFGLIKSGAKVKVFSRDPDKTRDVGKDFGVEVVSVKDLDEVKNYDIIINASPVGMQQDETPVKKELLNQNQIVFDLVYTPKETRLIKEAKEKGAVVIYGYEMLLYQGVEQFKIYTKYEAPVREMEEALIKSL